jgi:hypothetical protein
MDRHSFAGEDVGPAIGGNPDAAAFIQPFATPALAANATLPPVAIGRAAMSLEASTSVTSAR